MKRFCLLLLLGIASVAVADEGMWTFENFPQAVVKQKYGVDIDAAWLGRVQRSITRLEGGCTGSFASPDGLVLTNHHCAMACISALSSATDNLVENGFNSGSRAGERQCPGGMISVLVSTEDITAKVNAAIAGMPDAQANTVRKQTLTRLESECTARAARGKQNPFACESVTLYQGGQYFLYTYKRYDDVRLVFAPENGIAQFGGDPDNFQFPRWCLDMSVLRAYENGKPAATPNFLRVDFAGPAVNEPVFVSGHPGTTQRLLTVPQLKTLRDIDLPLALLRRAELRGRLLQFAKTSDQARHIAEVPLDTLQNTLKVQRKELDALHVDALFETKTQEEQKIKAQIASSKELGGPLGDPWAEIAKAEEESRALDLPYTMLESAAGLDSRLYRYARTLLRGGVERGKPSDDRLREYRDTALPRIEQQLAANVPTYPELEQLTLSFSLERMREWLGPDDPTVRQLLGKESPDQLAKRLITGTKLADPKARMALWTGGSKAVDASDDPLIQIAKMVDGRARAVRKQYEDQIEAVEKTAAEHIAKARFAAFGTSVYPDATFTLRLSYGSVQGWVENGKPVEPFTPLSRLFERATGEDPFAVPESWLKAKSQLDLTTRFNLTTTNDIVGGNSGSALINARGNIVGLVFDGNIHSISGAYWFDAERNRTVAVDTAIIKEALSKVYGAKALVAELQKPQT